ncbi:MAG TPA: hypothetical protein VHC43_07115 [Mycobacteriales bacterium]|nr:hypothetical protein [Mycobacteriales bacterium]
MLLVDVSRLRSVELHVVGYEIDPESAWLDVAGQVTVGSSCWSWQEACLTLEEAERLGEWLVAASSGPPDELDLMFVEQDLCVRFIAATAETVTLDWDLPAADGAKNTSSRVRISTPRSELLSAVHEWRSGLAALPDR